MNKDWYYLNWPTITSASSNIYTVTVNVPSNTDALSGQAAANGAWQYQYVYQNAPQIPQSVYNWYDNLMGMQYQMMGVSPANTVYWQQPETAEEKAEREERVAKREAAEARAQKLLFTILTPTQVKQYTDDDYFEVPVNERLYRLKKGRSMNVELIEAGKATIKFCAHPQDAYDLPVPDVMLSQLLALRANEAGFLAVANRTVLQ